MLVLQPQDLVNSFVHSTVKCGATSPTALLKLAHAKTMVQSTAANPQQNNWKKKRIKMLHISSLDLNPMKMLLNLKKAVHKQMHANLVKNRRSESWIPEKCLALT